MNKAQSSNRTTERLGLATLALLTLISRLLTRSSVLFHWDSVNFAYAVGEFNLVKEQPQPPGYLLYVWLIRGVDLLFRDPQTSMVWVSILSSVGAVIALYFLGKAMYGARVGWLSASFLAASPLFWFYGSIALPHTLDALLVILSVWFLYRALQGDRGAVLPAVVAMAAAGGVRQQTLVFLLPVALYALHRLGWKAYLTAAVVGATLSLAWLIPLLALSGGLQNYIALTNAYTDRFLTTTSLFKGAGWFGIRRNAIKLIFYSAYGSAIFIVPVIGAVAAGLIKKVGVRIGERSIFMALWVAPTVLFYGLIHMGQQGLVFVFLPALLLLGAASLDWLLHKRMTWLVGSAAAMILVSVAIFWLLPEYPMGVGGQRVWTRQALINNDKYFGERITALRAEFDPANTVILASNWHHVQYYLPEFRVLPFTVGSKWEVDEGRATGAASEEVTVSAGELASGEELQVVVFDPQLFAFNASGSALSLVQTSGGEMGVMRLSGTEQLLVGSESFGIVRR
ncbi:MAG: glycosyltransferase family 39 protein [Anaerolineae bacterium]|nr:glycosyltransferase family 39 protein [Anaerolineae bacterium]